MTINERVPPKRLAEIIASAEVCDDSVLTDYRDIESIARELQQYRAAAELEVSDDELNAALTVHRLKTDGHSQLSDAFRAGYKYARRAAPQVTSVPDDFDAWAKAEGLIRESYGLRSVNSITDVARKAWSASRAAMLSNVTLTDEGKTAAPAVQAEQLSGNTEQVSQTYTLTFDQWLSQQAGEIDVDCGCVTTEAFFHWLRLAYEAGNSPVIPDGWTGSDKANAALVMLDRIDTLDPVDDDRIEGIKRIIRELASAPKQEAE